jgi:hypothetical protein
MVPGAGACGKREASAVACARCKNVIVWPLRDLGGPVQQVQGLERAGHIRSTRIAHLPQILRYWVL